MRWKLAVLTLGLGWGANFAAPSPALGQSAASQQKSAINAISDVRVDEQAAGTFVRIEGSSHPTFSVYKLTSPLRLLIDLSNSEIDGEPKTEKVNNGVISQVALLEFSDSVQSITRVIVGFDQAAHYDVRTEGNDVVIFVDGAKRSTPGVGNVAAVEEELRKSRARLEETRQRLGALESSYKERLQTSATRVTRAENELTSTRGDLARAQADLENLREQLAAAKGSERARVNSEIARQKEAVDRLEKNLDAQRSAVASLRDANAELERERDAERARAQELVKKMELALRRAEESQRERDEALAMVAKKEREERAARDRARSLRDRLQAAERDLERARTAASSSRDTVAQRTRELEEARKRQQKLERQIASLRKSAADQQSREALASLEEEREALAATLDDRQGELARARDEAREAGQRLGELEKALASRDAEIARLKQEISVARKDVQAAEDDRLAAERQAVARERQRVEALEEARKAEERQIAALKKAQDVERSKLAALEQQRSAHEAELARLQEVRERRPAARAVAVDPNTVRAVRLEQKDGRSRVVVDLDSPGAFETMAGPDGRAVMILDGATLPSDLQKTLAGTRGGAVRYVSTFRDEQGQVRLEAELGVAATEIVRQEGSTLVWEFAPTLGHELAGGPHVGPQTRTEQGNEFTSAPPGYPTVVTDPTRVSSVPGMSRKRLTIDLREADIQNVLRLLAKEGGVNIVSGAGVGGTVTLRLRSVPLDEVFLTVLQSRGLGFEKRGNVIRVAPQETLRREEAARAEERARNARQKPLEVFLLPVNYASASELQAQVAPLLSPRGSATVDGRTNTLIIKDIAENLGAVRALVSNLDTEVPQVLIEARIVETNDTFQQQFGIQWGGDLTFSQANGNPTGLIFPHVLGIAGGATDGQTPTAGTSPTPNFAVNLPAPAGTGTGGALGLTLGSVGGALNINLRISALEQAGHAKLISAPKILTLDNTPATISQGTSIPISVVSAAGVQTVFVDATLELTVQPHVTPDGNIQLRIEASKNEPDFQNTGARGDPTIIRKQATTELLIKDGDTTVIGGIYTRNSGSAVSAVPFLHKIPILGYFFRTTTESDRRTELLIFITPKIVNRARALGAVSGGTVTTDETQ